MAMIWVVMHKTIEDVVLHLQNAPTLSQLVLLHSLAFIIQAVSVGYNVLRIVVKRNFIFLCLRNSCFLLICNVVS